MKVHFQKEENLIMSFIPDNVMASFDIGPNPTRLL